MKKCPKCRTQHFDGADLCDCGYRFSSGQVESSQSTSTPKKSKKGIITTTAVLALALIAGKYFGQMVGTEAASIRSSISTETPDNGPLESQIIDLAAEINSRTPNMVDSNTRLDKAVAGPGLSMTYLYTIPKFAAADLDQFVASDAASMIVAHACSSAPLVGLLKQGVTATYVYRGNDGKDIVRTQVHASDCADKGSKT